jgi:hypothetical protein
MLVRRDGSAELTERYWQQAGGDEAGGEADDAGGVWRLQQHRFRMAVGGA